MAQRRATMKSKKEDKNTAWLRQSPTDASAAFFPRPKKEPLSNCSSMLDPKKERRGSSQLTDRV